jgi:hypothetical protein
MLVGLIRGSVGFVMKCISVLQDNSYHQRIIIRNFMYRLTLFIEVNNCKLVSYGRLN